MQNFTETELKNEIWKDIHEFEGIYQVSDLGRVKSLNYNHTKEERILKPGFDKGGYYRVVLCKNGKKKTLTIHTLVIKAFKPEEYKKCIESIRKWVIDHKIEGNKFNNRLSNLQVITQKENTQKSKDKSQTSSQYKGVSFHKQNQKWQSEIKINSKNTYLGSFATEIEAHEAVQKAEEMANNGDFSFIKFREKTSKYKGVSFNKQTQKWIAYITINGQRKHLGLFLTELEAHQARQKFINNSK